MSFKDLKLIIFRDQKRGTNKYGWPMEFFKNTSSVLKDRHVYLIHMID